MSQIQAALVAHVHNLTNLRESLLAEVAEIDQTLEALNEGIKRLDSAS